MGCAQSSLSPQELQIQNNSRDIDKYLKADGKYVAQQVKILLLGPGESGKSTVFKQCQLLQDNSQGFSEAEKISYVSAIRQNLVSQMAVLVHHAGILGIAFSQDNAVHCQSVLSASPHATLDAALAQAVKALWEDEAMSKVISFKDKKFHLNDSAAYFFNKIDTISQPAYTPSVDDILRVRIRSTGIDEAEFAFGELHFNMFDVGGQRSERRKWIHCFENVTAVLFVASLVGYAQVLREDDSQNCMRESLLLLQELCNSPWFRTSTFIIFLNKIDLFKDKLAETPLSACFSDCKVPQTDEEGCLRFIQDRFQDCGRGRVNRNFYIHRTCAVDTEQIKFVLGAVKKTLLDQILSDTGISLS